MYIYIYIVAAYQLCRTVCILYVKNHGRFARSHKNMTPASQYLHSAFAASIGEVLSPLVLSVSV